jgi:HEAT repeat protein
MRSTPDLRALLAQGKHGLSLGRIPEVVALLATRPALAPRLIEYLWDEDEGVSQRAADVLERISRKPSPPIQHAMADAKQALLGLLPEASPKKLRWNLALMVGRLPLTPKEARRAAMVLESWLDDASSIVKTAALQGLADLIRHAPASLPGVLDLLRIQGRSGTPAMRARSRILLLGLEKRQRSNRGESRIE